MVDGPRQKRARLWVRVYASLFDVDQTATTDRPAAGESAEDTDETDDVSRSA